MSKYHFEFVEFSFGKEAAGGFKSVHSQLHSSEQNPRLLSQLRTSEPRRTKKKKEKRKFSETRFFLLIVISFSLDQGFRVYRIYNLTRGVPPCFFLYKIVVYVLVSSSND